MTKWAPYIVAIPLAISVAAIALPALVVGILAALGAAVLRLRWWSLVIASLLSLGIVLALGLDPADRVEKVIKRTQRTWTIGKVDPTTGLAFGNKKQRHKKRGNMFDRLMRKAPRLFVLGLPASVPLGFIFGAVALAWLHRDRGLPDLNADTQRSRKMRQERVRGQRRVRGAPESIKGRAVLGPALTGDLPAGWLARKWLRGEFVVYDEANLGRHIVVVGQPGSGKTVTLMQLAYLASKVYGWRVFFLDGKGDHATQHEFIATMLHAGVRETEVGAFPLEPFDGWRTTGTLDDRYAQLLNRLLGVVKFTEPYYEDAARAFVGQALMLEGSLPESSEEFLERVEVLIKASTVEQRREAMGTLLRYRAFFDSFRGKLDGSWSFEDKRAAYVLLEGLAQPKEAGKLATYLFESFKQFAAHAKHPNDRILLIVDEFPAVQEDADAAGLIERLRSFGCSVALSAQSYEGLGASRDRIITAARSLMVHSCPSAEEIVRLAGTREAYAVTHQVDYHQGPTGLGSARAEQRFRVDPNLLGSLHDGEAFVIAQRRAHLVRVARRVIPDAALLRATERMRPKVEVERPHSAVPESRSGTEPSRAIDW